MKIGELAAATGVPATTIRYYEEIDLLPQPARLPNGYRDYDHRALARLRFVRDAQASGLSLTEVASILELREQGSTTCEHVAQLLEDHMRVLDRRIADLEVTRANLAELTLRARAMDPSDCTDPDRCQTITSEHERAGLLAIHNGPHAHRH